MKTLLFVGNFLVPHSTENDLKWTFEKLGWHVIAIQENTEIVPLPDDWVKADAFLYVHTHGWGNPADIQTLIDMAKSAGIPTASFHLDRYWGLDAADSRESLVGDHPFWKTDHVFTADGGNDARFAARGVNHHWLKPGVVERDCYLGTPDPEFQVDVAFVGSRYYHPEYPQRGQLIEWLESTYGDRFRRFAGDTPSGTVRGSTLNDLYASVKVVVGDCCFAGEMNYWSDRIPETTGRGGFLIHPNVPGLDHLGVAKFNPGDYLELRELIDHFLTNDEARENMRRIGHEWTKRNATYTNRVREMLDVMKVGSNV